VQIWLRYCKIKINLLEVQRTLQAVCRLALGGFSWNFIIRTFRAFATKDTRHLAIGQ